jgi:hypothetical protein
LLLLSPSGQTTHVFSDICHPLGEGLLKLSSCKAIFVSGCATLAPAVTVSTCAGKGRCFQEREVFSGMGVITWIWAEVSLWAHQGIRENNLSGASKTKLWTK